MVLFWLLLLGCGDSSKGTTILETTLFPFDGNRNHFEVEIDPAEHLLPWHLYTSSDHGPLVQLIAGANELLFAVTPADLEAVVAKLQ